MLATLTDIRSFAVRAIGVLGVAAAAAVLSPIGLASADDQALPGAPVIRGADRATASTGTGELRPGTKLADANGNYVAIQGGDAPTSNGGGVVKDGNMTKPPPVGHGTLCGTDAAGGYAGGTAFIECGGDFQPYN